jgi:hypothetical protein
MLDPEWTPEVPEVRNCYFDPTPTFPELVVRVSIFIHAVKYTVAVVFSLETPRLSANIPRMYWPLGQL